MASIVFLFISMFNTFPSKSPQFLYLRSMFYCTSSILWMAAILQTKSVFVPWEWLYCFAVKQQVRFPQVHLYTEEKWLPVLCLDDKCSVRTKFTKAHVGNIDHRLLPFLTYFLEKCKFLYNIQHYGSLLIFLICKKFASISKLK